MSQRYNQVEVEGAEVVVLKTERKLLRDTRKVMLASNICQESALRFMEDMAILTEQNSEPVTVILASSGGGVECGLSCIRAIHKAQKAGVKIIGEVHGYAMSMAFLILECCDERTMGKPDVLMAHGFTTFTIGDMRNLESERKLLKLWQAYFAELVASRCKKAHLQKPEYWMPIMEDNTPLFYSSTECLEMGLIDSVED